MTIHASIAGGVGEEPPPASDESNTVILVHSDDPYYTLAEEIAESESLPVVHSIDEAIARSPIFLLWVMCPSRFSDSRVVDFGVKVRGLPSVISVGIISGSTLEKARALWKRAPQARGERLVAVNQANPTARIFEDRIISFHNGERTTQSLTRANLKDALQDADYLTFTGHGGTNYWGVDKKATFAASDVPSLPPVVLSSGGCQTFRIHRRNSIALRFTDQGAAAYSGFVFSPNGGVHDRPVRGDSLQV